MNKLKDAARFLKNAAPEEFNNFLICFRDYVYETIDACSEAPADEVLHMQGRAKQCKALYRMLEECDFKPAPAQPVRAEGGYQ